MTSDNYKFLPESSATSSTSIMTEIARDLSDKSAPASKTEAVDYVALVSGGKIVATSDTVSFVSKLEEQIKKVARVSDEVITSLRRNLDYSGYHISYLMDQISQEDFAKISEEFALERVSGLSEELLNKIQILFYISTQSYTPSELSDIFRIDEETAEKAIDRLKELNLIDSRESY